MSDLGSAKRPRDARLSGVVAALQVVRGVGAGWRGGWPFVAAAVPSTRFRMTAKQEAGRAAEAPQGRTGGGAVARRRDEGEAAM